ncbi:MAG TPA: glycosyltransferase family 4 protein [Chthoniobacteraceae bacterium]|nr:glycosyltransferase family 4 protein [Chthoniobacteraceae bacterium]
MTGPIVVAIITTDLRDDHRRYDEPQPSFGAAPTGLLQGLKNMEGCEVHVVSCVQRPVASPEKIADNMFYHSVEIGKWGWMRGLYAGCIRAAGRKLREIGPDIVHGQGTERYCALSAVFSGFPNVATIHGKMSEVARHQHGAGAVAFYGAARLLEEFTLPRTDGIVCISDYMRGLVSKYRVPAWIVPNALQEIYFESPGKKAGGRGKPVLINAGVISERKRQVELLGMAGRLHARGANFEFQFAGSCAGESAYAREFLAKVKPAEEAGYARYLGALPAGELVKRYDEAGAMVHFPGEEAFGLVVAEALARNLKFFGARTGGITGIASGVEGAELIGPDDWEGLEHAIVQWLDAGAPTPAGAAEEMKARYHPRVIARRHLEIYSEVVRRKKSANP